MKALLDEFVAHMKYTIDDELLDAFGTNCENAGWDYEDNSNILYKGFSTGDVMKCKLMSAALVFMNTVRIGKNAHSDRSPNDQDMREILGCVVVNMYMNILRNAKCGHKWKGIHYAWKVAKKMGNDEGGAAFRSAITHGTCSRDGWRYLNIGKKDIRSAVDAWLRNNEHIMAEIQKAEASAE
ncbi:hypothetical protein AK88_05409, partial [Plasmodium fragile]